MDINLSDNTVTAISTICFTFMIFSFVCLAAIIVIKTANKEDE